MKLVILYKFWLINTTSIKKGFDNKNIMKGLVARNGNIEKDFVDKYAGFRYNWHCCENILIMEKVFKIWIDIIGSVNDFVDENNTKAMVHKYCSIMKEFNDIW